MPGMAGGACGTGVKVVTARAHANIAFVKYWGNRDPDRRVPHNSSLSMNLSAATSTTTVTFEPGRRGDRVVVDGETRYGPAYERVVEQLDRIRRHAGIGTPAVVESTNTFPMATGIASSASGFAALTLAATVAAGLVLTERELSVLARLASGSAARSIPSGFVEWHAADTDEGSFAESIAPPEHWDLRDLVAVVSRQPKHFGSTEGHAAAVASAYFPSRLVELRQRIPAIRRAILARDMATLGPAIEAEAISLHVIAMTGRPPMLYWQPDTLALLHQVYAWRAEGIPVYFTLDAGANVHLICEGHVAARIEPALRSLEYVKSVLHNRPAGPAQLVGD